MNVTSDRSAYVCDIDQRYSLLLITPTHSHVGRNDVIDCAEATEIMGTLAPSRASPHKKENQTLLNNKSFHLLTVQQLRYVTSCWIGIKMYSHA